MGHKRGDRQAANEAADAAAAEINVLISSFYDTVLSKEEMYEHYVGSVTNELNSVNGFLGTPILPILARMMMPRSDKRKAKEIGIGTIHVCVGTANAYRTRAATARKFAVDHGFRSSPSHSLIRTSLLPMFAARRSSPLQWKV